MLTQATVINDNDTKPECVVCLNHILSNVEHQDEIVSEQQEQKPESKEEKEPTTLLLSTTSAIFTPKETAVMSKEFLNFPDADILLFQEPLKDSKLQFDLDLFSEDPCSLESGICEDPFSYRGDDSLSSPSYCGTPESSLHLNLSSSTSPDPFNTTPSTPDSGSLSDIPSLDTLDEFSNLKFTMPPSDKDSDCFEEDLDFRAPFIPMQMDDDFPLISPSSCVMWGPQEHPKKPTLQERLSEPQRSSPKQSPTNDNSLKSSLAALLQSDVKKTSLNNKHLDKNGNHRREQTSQKRWQNATTTTDNNKNNSTRQRNFTPSRINGNSNRGHIIMLDSLPIKKQPIKTNRNGTSTMNDRRSNTPPFGSHTSTVRVNDRLIKVQVSVSELPTTPIEHKQPFPSPPDPPPKRSSPSRPGPTDSPKRLKVDNASGPQGLARDSVLLNLLISGEDASRGYLCSGNTRYSGNKLEPAVLSLPAINKTHSNDSSLPSHCTSSELLSSDCDLLDSFLKISQYDSSSDDLLDHPLMRNVPMLV